ncbi:hypothetical protein WJX72_005554 [[Myrmecia] bisecta]|uniref:Uncharacterized protein n=1 Tax=[Myrmecia] bisecta TaxID=41462 RepID=A0AAW1R715_9CHLO
MIFHRWNEGRLADCARAWALPNVPVPAGPGGALTAAHMQQAAGIAKDYLLKFLQQERSHPRGSAVAPCGGGPRNGFARLSCRARLGGSSAPCSD